MHVNSGYFKEALPVVANHVRAFEKDEYDVAVAPSGSCVASVKHQHPMVARRCGDTALEARAAAVGHKTYELSQLLVDVPGITDAAPHLGSYFPHRITCHPAATACGFSGSATASWTCCARSAASNWPNCRRLSNDAASAGPSR